MAEQLTAWPLSGGGILDRKSGWQEDRQMDRQTLAHTDIRAAGITARQAGGAVDRQAEKLPDIHAPLVASRQLA